MVLEASKRYLDKPFKPRNFRLGHRSIICCNVVSLTNSQWLRSSVSNVSKFAWFKMWWKHEDETCRHLFRSKVTRFWHRVGVIRAVNTLSWMKDWKGENDICAQSSTLPNTRPLQPLQTADTLHFSAMEKYVASSIVASASSGMLCLTLIDIPEATK